MDQQSTDWYVWRSQGIGSSDVAAILGLSPFCTPLQLYRMKVGLDPQITDNFATYRGRKFEPKARACFELSSFKEYQPKLFQSKEYPFMRVSLDGWNEDEREILEIKCPGKETLVLAAQGQIPEYYLAQIQYQLFVADGRRAIYFAFDPDLESGHEVEVFPDDDFMTRIAQATIEFWMRIQRKNPPPLNAQDWLEFSADYESLIIRWKKAQFEGLKAESIEIKRLLTSKMTHPKMRGFGIRIFATKTKSGGLTYRVLSEKSGEVGELEENICS